MQISTPGVVVRDFRYEQNRILTILTRDYGIVTAYANRAVQPRSPLAGATELLCYSDFVLYKGKQNYTVNQADSIQLFFSIRSRYEDFALASYFAQLFDELSPHEEPAPLFLQLLLNCLHFLDNQKKPTLQIKAIAELRILTLSGYMPNLVGCSVCDAYESETMYFDFSGQLFCQNCYHPEEHQKVAPLSSGVLAAMRHIIYAEPKKIFSFTLSPEGFRTLGKISEDYLLFQLEKTLPTLEFYRGLQ